jgi:uncharacterized protein (DUF433 family)
VQKTPGVCGGRACIRTTRIIIWGLVNDRQLGATDGQLPHNIVGLTPDDLLMAWEYYREHPAEIDEDTKGKVTREEKSKLPTHEQIQ